MGAPQGNETRTLIARATGALGGFVFGPASLATIIGGIGLAIRGQYGNQLWIQWGMGAVHATIVVGVVGVVPSRPRPSEVSTAAPVCSRSRR